MDELEKAKAEFVKEFKKTKLYTFLIWCINKLTKLLTNG